jgi:hypothetical protein
MIFNDDTPLACANAFAKKGIRIVFMVENIRHDHDVKRLIGKGKSPAIVAGHRDRLIASRRSFKSKDANANLFPGRLFHQFEPELSRPASDIQNRIAIV